MRPRGLRVIVAIALVGCAACLLVVAQAESDTAAMIRHLGRAAQGAWDTGRMDTLASGAAVFCAVAVVLAIAIAAVGTRTLFAIVAVASLLFVGAGLWLAVSTEPVVWSGGLPHLLPREAVAALLVGSGLITGAGSIAAVIVLPGLPPIAQPHMPPPTHQGG